ncbi:MAG: sulfatase-like hydrolase/transferase [Chloroflexota bacterium]
MALARWSAAAFVAAYVLISFSATPNPMMALWRPLLVGVAVAVALQLLLGLVLRDGDRAEIAASAVVLVLGAAWVPLAVLVVAVIWLLAIQLMRRRRGEPALGLNARTVARNLGVFAWAFATVAAIPVVGWAIASYHPADGAIEGATGTGRPDIVLLLVDGYPRADSLVEQFGVDNSAFVTALTTRGFLVAAHSRSNYTATWASLSSMFYGRYVDEIHELAPPPADPAEQYRRVMLALGRAPVLDGFRRDGYEIVTIPSAFESAALTSADRILTPPEWTSFELSLIQRSLAGQLAFRLAPGVVFDQHRARLESTLQLLGDEMARTSATPRFVFAHLLAPHAPVAFRADGSPAEPPACFPGCSPYGITSAADWEGFPGQVTHVNELVVAVLDRIIGDDPGALIILMSDHGSPRTGEAPANAFRNFFAARAPANEVQYEDDVTPMTVLARLTDLPFTSGDPYRAWISAGLEPLTLTPYTGPEP